VSAQVPMTDTITQYGITWTFDGAYEFGRFANGDYWVVGPVTVTRITPDFDGLHHGWEVNPVPAGDQGFETRIGSFDAALIPALPYAAQPGESIIKSISLEPLSDTGCRPCLKTAAVLTVLGAAPPDGGATIFRPPYVADQKPLHSINGLRTGLLPSLPAVDDAPSLADVEGWFKPVQMDHKPGRTSTYMRPQDNLPFYGADIARLTGDAALRLMLDDPLEDKMPALIAYLQCGLDYYHFMINGQLWPPGGGEQPGSKLPIVFFVALLGDEAMQETVRSTELYEDYHAMYGHDGVSLFGDIDWGGYWSEVSYWRVLIDDVGGRTKFDPYGYIDGGVMPGGYYQFCCTSQPFKGVALSVLLMPALQKIWHPQALIDYVDRWVDFGTWTQPDPCAPVDGVCVGGENDGQPCQHRHDCPNGSCDAWDNYGVTFGPDGNGGCILDTDPSDGIGRFPHLHGTAKDGGHRYSHFQAALWNAYRHLYTLSLTGVPASETIYLTWTLDTTLPATTTWTLRYDGPAGDQPSPVAGLPEPARAYTLTGLTNYTWYTVTLNAMLDETPFLTDTVRVMPVGPALQLDAAPGDGQARLTWNILRETTPFTGAWRIGYESDTGTLLLPPLDIPTSTVRAWTLTGLSNYVWYTVTLEALLDASPWLSDTVRVMPTDRFVYLPLVLR